MKNLNIHISNALDKTKDKNFLILKKELKESLTQLKQREREILKMRYGLDGYKRFTLREVGNEFNITAERVRQIQEHALKKIIQKMSVREHKDTPFSYGQK
ncbi:MAG: sigma-70 family RNA polymerase sigma factor [Spirochaetales bacterium]|nr:sigma-70 family RNA polymerase sigma factor [Spirochaetales bacterium]